MNFTLEMEQLRAARRASRIPRPRARPMTKEQLAAYYGLAEDSVYSSQPSQDSPMNEDVEEEAGPSNNNTYSSMSNVETSKASIEFRKSTLDAFKCSTQESEFTITREPEEEAASPNNDTYSAETSIENSKASITFGKSTLDAFNSIRRSQSTVNEYQNEDNERQLESLNNQTAESCMETSKASITFGQSTLDAFKSIRRSQSTVHEEVERQNEDNKRQNESFNNQTTESCMETSKASITFGQSTLDAFKSIRRSQSTVNEERQNENNERQIESFNNQTAESIMETSKASITFSKSALDAFNSIRRSQSTVNEEVERQLESFTNKTAESCMETSKASITFQKSTLAIFNSQHAESTINEDIEAEMSKNATVDADTSKASITFQKSTLAIFNPQYAESTIYEDDEAEASKNLTVAADGSVETSKTSSGFQNSSFDGFKSSRNNDSAMDVDFEDAQSSKSCSYVTDNCAENSKASIVFQKSTMDLFKTSQINETTVNGEIEEEAESSKSFKVPTAPRKSILTTMKPSDISTINEEGEEEMQALRSQSSIRKNSEAAPPQPIRSRMSVLLPRFMQHTFASKSHAKEASPNQCKSPLCERKSPCTTPKSPASKRARISTTPRRSSTVSQSKKADASMHITPRKTIAKTRSVNDQSFHAAKMPMLNLEEFNDLPAQRFQLLPSPPVVDFDAMSIADDDKENTVNKSHGFDISSVSCNESADDSSNVSGYIEEEEEESETNELDRSIVDEMEKSGYVDDLAAEASRRAPRVSNPVNVQNDFANLSFDTFDENRQDLNSSVYSYGTPGINRVGPPCIVRAKIPMNFDDSIVNETFDIVNETAANQTGITNNSYATSSNDIIKMTAAVQKDEKKRKYVLQKPKLIKPESPAPEDMGRRRSQRTRIRALRSDLGEQAIYEVDANGMRKLVGVSTVEITNNRAQKFGTIDPAEQIAREKALKNGQKMRKEFAKQQKENVGWQ